MHFFLFLIYEPNIYVITCTMNFLLLKNALMSLICSEKLNFCGTAKNAVMSLIYSEEFGLHLAEKHCSKSLICSEVPDLFSLVKNAFYLLRCIYKTKTAL